MTQQELDVLKTYLSYDEIKEICIEECRRLVREGVNSIKPDKRIDNYERIISNAVHYYLETEIDQILDVNTKELIKSNVLNILTKPEFTKYSIFRTKNSWDNEDSIGTKYLKEAVTENKNYIKEKVKSVIEEIDFNNLKEDIKEYILEVIDEKFSKSLK